MTFVMDESLGSADELEAKINELEDVQSVETVDVRRAIG
jgi:translation elongation factor EF-1beta